MLIAGETVIYSLAYFTFGYFQSSESKIKEDLKMLVGKDGMLSHAVSASLKSAAFRGACGTRVHMCQTQWVVLVWHS